MATPKQKVISVKVDASLYESLTVIGKVNERKLAQVVRLALKSFVFKETGKRA